MRWHVRARQPQQAAATRSQSADMPPTAHMHCQLSWVCLRQVSPNAQQPLAGHSRSAPQTSTPPQGWCSCSAQALEPVAARVPPGSWKMLEDAGLGEVVGTSPAPAEERCGDSLLLGKPSARALFVCTAGLACSCCEARVALGGACLKVATAPGGLRLLCPCVKLLVNGVASGRARFEEPAVGRGCPALPELGGFLLEGVKVVEKSSWQAPSTTSRQPLSDTRAVNGALAAAVMA